jgi:hypothetical protein
MWPLVGDCSWTCVCFDAVWGFVVCSRGFVRVETRGVRASGRRQLSEAAAGLGAVKTPRGPAGCLGLYRMRGPSYTWPRLGDEEWLRDCEV